MGNKYYFLLLIPLIGLLIAIYFIFDFGVMYYFVAGGIVLFYLLMKDEFSGSNWFPAPKVKQIPSVPHPEKHAVSKQLLIATETIKEGYKNLIRLCVNEKNRTVINRFIETLSNYAGEEDEDYTVLNYVMDYLDDNHFFHFIMRMDWKADVEDLEWQLSNAVQDNFGISLDFPDSDEKYGTNACISTGNVFVDYDSIVRKAGLQMGFLDTESDEYVIVVHRIGDRNEVEKAINQIGYKYFESIQLRF